MNMHSFPVHKQYIKYSSVLLAVYNPSVIKNRKVSAVRFSKMKVDVIIFIAGIDLFPDACFYLLLFILTDQVVEAFICKAEEFIYSFISGHLKELMVCIQEFIIIFVRSVYDKCTRKVFRDILECKSELFTDS